MKNFLIAAVFAGAVAALAGCSTQPTAPVDDKSTTATPRHRHHGGCHDQRHQYLGRHGLARPA